MIRHALLALALLAQTPTERVAVKGVKIVPAYTLAKLKASNAKPPLTWSIYQLVPVSTMQSGDELGFTAPPGNYLVILTAANGEATWQIRFGEGTAPTPTPSPPSPQPGPPTPPKPQPDPNSGGFIYPPESTGFGASVSTAIRGSRSYSPDETMAMSSLYRFTAEKIRLDGLRIKPQLKTLSDAMSLTKSTEDELLKSSKVRPIKEAFPEVAKLAAAGLSQANPADQLTPQARAQYVEFLNQLASGFDQARPQ